jgi:hypothetical protein
VTARNNDEKLIAEVIYEPDDERVIRALVTLLGGDPDALAEDGDEAREERR